MPPAIFSVGIWSNWVYRASGCCGCVAGAAVTEAMAAAAAAPRPPRAMSATLTRPDRPDRSTDSPRDRTHRPVVDRPNPQTGRPPARAIELPTDRSPGLPTAVAAPRQPRAPHPGEVIKPQLDAAADLERSHAFVDVAPPGDAAAKRIQAPLPPAHSRARLRYLWVCACWGPASCRPFAKSRYRRTVRCKLMECVFGHGCYSGVLCRSSATHVFVVFFQAECSQHVPKT